MQLEDFVTVDNDAIATEDLPNEVLAKSTAKDTDGFNIDSDDDGPNRQLPVVSAITTVDMLCAHFAERLRDASSFSNSTQWKWRS